jgi:hypothetical protein
MNHNKMTHTGYMVFILAEARIYIKSTRMSSASRRCWMQQMWWTRSTTAKTEYGVTSLTTGGVPTGTQPVASLHQRSTAEGVIGMTATCATSSAAQMRMAGSKFDAKSKSAWSRNDTTRGTMIIMVRTMTNLTDNTPLKEGIIQEESKLFPMT